MRLPLMMLAACIGYTLIWLAMDQHLVGLGVAAGIIFGGAMMHGTFGR